MEDENKDKIEKVWTREEIPDHQITGFGNAEIGN